MVFARIEHTAVFSVFEENTLLILINYDSFHYVNLLEEIKFGRNRFVGVAAQVFSISSSAREQ
jgi:hypothetical protein